MTNAELLATIRAEIERLNNKMDDRDPLAPNQKAGYLFALADVLSFLSTIESENPMQDGLEKEIENAWEKLEKDYSPSALDKTTILVSGLVGEKQFSKIARHFTQWGAEHLGSSETPNDIEEAAEKSLRLAGFHNMETRGMDWKGGFIAGAKWQDEQDKETIELAEEHAYLAGSVNEREKMMKDAVEGRVILRDMYDNRSLDVDFVLPDNLKIGDKVKVIVAKDL